MIAEIHTHEIAMRTNIEIDDALLAEAMEVTGLKTKRATVEEGLRQILAERRARQALKNLRGIGWQGDLEEMRDGWTFDDPRS